MRGTLKVSIVLSLSLGALIACSNDEDTSNNSNSSNEENEQNESEMDESNQENDDSDEDDNYGMPEKQGIDDDNTDDESDTNLGEGETDDQLDLSIGDTGLIETTEDKFEVTLNSAKISDNIDEVTPNGSYDRFIMANVTITNEHSAAINLSDVIDILEVTVYLDTSGYGEASGNYDFDINGFSGDLEPGESMSGDLLFETVESEEHYLRVTEGLIAASAVKNQVIWTFTEEEAE